jgi:hypothetical protein
LQLHPVTLKDAMHNVPCDLEIDVIKAGISKCKRGVLSNMRDELCVVVGSKRKKYLEGLYIKCIDVVVRRGVLWLK